MAMKIKTIEIDNYKAFYGNQNKIAVDGKNLFIYGENGSGKSSLYYALKDFVQGSIEPIDLGQVENIFIPSAETGKVKVKITFNPDSTGAATDQVIELSARANPHNNPEIRDTNQLRSFLNYKHLLDIHNIKKDEEINLFDLLVKGVLREFKPIGMSKSLGDTWKNIEDLLLRKTDRSYDSSDKRRDLGVSIGNFNTGFETLFNIANPDYILTQANPILQQFDKAITIKLSYNRLALDAGGSLEKLNGGKVKIEIEYGGKIIDKPHLFLNEARLSAIAISIYLGMIKRLPQIKKFKILFLDDLFIGLDLSNRMPLLEILKSEFADYQIIISTYDRPWYEVASLMLDNDPNWKRIELLARTTSSGYDIPVIPSNDRRIFVNDLVNKAEYYYNKGDNKASGVYIRSAYEFILKKFCFNRVPVKFNTEISKIEAEDFWVAIKKYRVENPSRCKLTAPTITEIERLKSLTLNPLSHHSLTKHQFSSEIRKTIDIINTLHLELS